jgi:hypothetical protein
VIPVIHVAVAGMNAGATSTSVTVSVNGAQAGDVVIIRPAGQSTGGQRGKLDSALTTAFAVTASQSQEIHYVALIPSTSTHGAHSLAFYVPASG